MQQPAASKPDLPCRRKIRFRRDRKDCSKPATASTAWCITERNVVLVTGGAGFIGSNFVLEAVRRGHTVVNLDALTYAGNLANLSSLDGNTAHIFVHGSILDGALIASLLADYRPHAIVHFAAESHVDRSILGPAAFVGTNINGTFTLLEAALQHWRSLPDSNRKDFRCLHVSTDEVYGSLSPAESAFHVRGLLAPMGLDLQTIDKELS